MPNFAEVMLAGDETVAGVLRAHFPGDSDARNNLFEIVRLPFQNACRSSKEPKSADSSKVFTLISGH
jgi:hypothetical protein